MITKFYVLVNRSLVLKNCKFDGDLLVEGVVVNGGWTYKHTGAEEQACTYGGQVVTQWPAEPQRLVGVPTNVRGKYERILAWAETQWAQNTPRTADVTDRTKELA